MNIPPQIVELLEEQRRFMRTLWTRNGRTHLGNKARLQEKKIAEALGPQSPKPRDRFAKKAHERANVPPPEPEETKFAKTIHMRGDGRGSMCGKTSVLHRTGDADAVTCPECVAILTFASARG